MDYIYPERESKSLEFKSKLPAFQNLVKTCVAFANGTGGKIIIGVDDKTRELIGIDEATRNRLYEEFPNSVYDATSPSLLIEIYERNFEDLSVMIIDVPSSIKKPVFIKSEGIPQGVYLRAGPNTRKASAEYIEELLRENKRLSFDEEAIHADTQILSQNLLYDIFGKVQTTRLVAEKILTPSGVKTKQYYPTVAGVLTFCETPHTHIPEAMVQCTRFHGAEGRNIIQSEEIHGCLEQQITTSFRLVRSWLMHHYQLHDTKLQGKMLIPETALREAIVNALLHRKYSIPGSVKIALYENRLEIFNPGNFPGLFDITNLGDGTTYLRNPNLARIARRFGIIEKLGTGIRLILASCKQAGLKQPEFIEGADSVKVIFHFLPNAESFSSDEAQLLALFNMHEIIKIEDVQAYLHVSRNTASRKLSQLLKAGLIQRVGKGPAVRYLKTQ